MESTKKNFRIGLLGIQGAYAAHHLALESIGAECVDVRYPHELDDLDGIVVPGGESSTILKLLALDGFGETLAERVRNGLPYFGTCAGAIVAAKEAVSPEQESLGLIDITVTRNAYGRQVDSFTADFAIPKLGIENFHGLFIRAPVISRIGENVEILHELRGDPVLVREKNVLLATFHPELSVSSAIHEYFLRMVADRVKAHH